MTTIMTVESTLSYCRVAKNATLSVDVIWDLGTVPILRIDPGINGASATEVSLGDRGNGRWGTNINVGSAAGEFDFYAFSRTTGTDLKTNTVHVSSI